MVRKYSAIVAAAIAMTVVTSAHAQEPAPKPAASLSGKSLIDGTMRPLAEVEVTIPALNLSALSDAKGDFRLPNIPPGLYQVRARKIGYARFEADVMFKSGENSEVMMLLPTVVVLDSMRVVGMSSLPQSYIEHRAAALGRFLTPDQLESQKNVKLANLMSQLSGLGMIRGTANQGWIISKRALAGMSIVGPASRGRPSAPEGFYQPDAAELRMGLKLACYARIYVGNLLLNSGSVADPIDINEYATSALEAVEYFAGPSQTPTEYSRLNSNCGVVVLHLKKGK